MTEGLLRTWVDPDPILPPEDFCEAIGGHPLVAQILYRRGIRNMDQVRAFMDPAVYTPAAPADLPGVTPASRRICQAIARGEKICVWGDFDVDGQTATALMVGGLRSLGAEVEYHIPVRASESHGVNIENLRPILQSGATLVITVDTGISAHEAVNFARQYGAEVIITDHHELPEDGLPQALAVVSPRLLPPDHALSGLPGVGVAYQLMAEIYRQVGRASESDLFLDLVALGIVSDLAVQTGDTRYLLQRGLVWLRQTGRVGLRAVMDQAGINPAWLSEEHVGFVIGPRLNALGRLGDANPAVELLTTGDEERARVLAIQLESLNVQRRHLSAQVLQGALSQIEKDRSLLGDPVLVLSHPTWPAGVIGIVASELSERYNRPTVLLASPPGQAARGSARSVAGVNITQAIASQEKLLYSFGGHPMAAGLSLAAENIPKFRRGLARAVDQALGGETPARPLLTAEGEVKLDEITLDLVADLERLAPFGPGNPPLALVVRGVKIVHATPIGRGGDHLQVMVENAQGQTRRVIWWGGEGWPLPEGWFDLACTIRASTYRGQRGVQVEWIDACLIDTGTVPALASYEILDFRGQSHPRGILDNLLREQPDLAVWAEAEAGVLPAATTRGSLTHTDTLVVWTTPPGQAELRAALQAVQPNRLVLFAIDPRDDRAESFLRRLTGLCKYAITHWQGETTFTRLVGATAQREKTVRLGLHWLEQRGLLQVEWLEDGALRLTPGGEPSQAADDTLAGVRALLAETEAYRDFFRSAPVSGLL